MLKLILVVQKMALKAKADASVAIKQCQCALEVCTLCGLNKCKYINKT